MKQLITAYTHSLGILNDKYNIATWPEVHIMFIKLLDRRSSIADSIASEMWLNRENI